MTIRELIEELEQMAEYCGDDTEVRLAFQPSWPFEHSISTIVAVDLADDEAGETYEEEMVVYISEGHQIGYLPGAASQELGWR